ncbi:MAG: L-2-amino-thiazoline-4-carboxylic acid hydrolase [Anaerolineaceae bacterium]|nr:L-2-amino-thiazoline-4-carboxylic acid hydrolase [Anaerolineaceae bacterium]
MTQKAKKRWQWLYILAGGVLLGWLFGKVFGKQARFPFLLPVQKALAAKYGEVEAAFLAGQIQQRYERLVLQRPRFKNRRSQLHVDQLVVPALALYQILLEKIGDRTQAVTEVQEVLFCGPVGKVARVAGLLKIVPGSHSVLRRVVRLANRIAFSGAGFDIRYTADDDQAVAFDIHRCLYLDVLTGYGAPELTPVFCYFDDYIAKFFPDEITWKRQSTLGRGGPYCDFCYARTEKKA